MWRVTLFMGWEDPGAPGWEKPEHTHPMEHSYWIGRNDVTRGQYRAFCAATGRAETEKSYFDDELDGDLDRQPVIMVSWMMRRPTAPGPGSRCLPEGELEKVGTRHRRPEVPVGERLGSREGELPGRVVSRGHDHDGRRDAGRAHGALRRP